MPKNKHAYIVFLIGYIQPVIAVILTSQFGMFRFSAAYYSNRLWVVAALAVLLPFLARMYLRQPNPLAYYVALLAGFGLIASNPLGSIAADLSLMLIVLGSTHYGFYLSRFSRVRWEHFFKDYLKLEIGALLLLVIPLRYLGVNIGFPYAFLLAASLWFLTSSALPYQKFLALALLVAAIFVHAEGKVFIVMVVAAFLALSASRRLSLGLVSVGFGGVILVLQFWEWISGYLVGIGAFGKTALLLRSLNIDRFYVSDLLSLTDPRNLFGLADASTGQRLFEASRVFEAISELPYWLVGRGLGAEIDLTGTADPSVLLAYGSDLDVQVVHLGLMYILLKGGLLGIGVFIWISILVAVRSVLAIRSGGWLAVAGLTALMSLCAAMFTFSLYIKPPIVGLCFGFVMATMERHRTERARSIEHKTLPMSGLHQAPS